MTKLLFLFLLFISISSFGQAFVANYDESKMPAYTLPDPLLFNNGKAVKNEADWEKRRLELLTIFENEVYGKTPAGKVELSAVVISENNDLFNGTATRREVQLKLKNKKAEVLLNLLIYLPKSNKKVPIFLGYNFNGNHTVSAEPDVAVARSWVRNNPTQGITANRSNESLRGSDASSWPISDILARGYGVATLYYGDVDPDFDDGFGNGVHALFPGKRDSTSWGSVAGWAWGLSRVMDWFQNETNIDAKKVIVLGHSRLGKAALWAGINDLRFAMVVSNESGCGGYTAKPLSESIALFRTGFA
jgi:hypothetical protein